MSGAGKSIRCGIGALALVMGSAIGLIEHAAAGEMSFTVTIEQLTTEETLKLPDGSATRRRSSERGIDPSTGSTARPLDLPHLGRHAEVRQR